LIDRGHEGNDGSDISRVEFVLCDQRREQNEVANAEAEEDTPEYQDRHRRAKAEQQHAERLE
jgi:hypothetical protein